MIALAQHVHMMLLVAMGLLTSMEPNGGESDVNDHAASWPVMFRMPQEGLGCRKCRVSRSLPCPAGLRETSRRLLAREGSLRSL